jgi:predicted ATPase
MECSNVKNAFGELQTAVDNCLAGPYKLMHGPYCLAILAQAYVHSGQFASGITMLQKAMSMVNTHDDRYYEAELYRLKGEFLAGNPSNMGEIEQCFQQAITIARRQCAKSLELRAAMSLARLWEQQGRRIEAHTLLAEIYGWFTEGFDTADLQEAQAMLKQLG